MNRKNVEKTDKSGYSLLKKTDVLLILSVFFVSVVLFFIYSGNKQDSLTAEITVNGEYYKTINLSDNHSEIIVIETNPIVTLKVENGSIAFVDSKCKDHYCEKCGNLNNRGNTAVCLPAKVMVRIESGNTNSVSDAISY